MSVPKSKQAVNRHARTRRDHATETAEDYVEAIWEFREQRGHCRVTDLAGRFAVSHVTVHRTVARLQRDRLISTEPYGPIELTEAGRELAQRVKQRHETVFRFLVAVGVPEKAATVDAEGIEHHVSDETLRAMQRFLRES
jgi:DtxR family transcriptional regulator, manganese transport regulator